MQKTIFNLLFLTAFVFAICFGYKMKKQMKEGYLMGSSINYQINPNPSFVYPHALHYPWEYSDSILIPLGDFNGDGRDDILRPLSMDSFDYSLIHWGLSASESSHPDSYYFSKIDSLQDSPFFSGLDGYPSLSCFRYFLLFDEKMDSLKYGDPFKYYNPIGEQTSINFINSVLHQKNRYGIYTFPEAENEYLIFFENGSLQLTNTTKERLLPIFKNLDPEHTIILKGYSDSLGEEEVNKKLSRKRAEAVKDFLVHINGNIGIVKTYGIGSSYPVANNETEEGRSLNRRVHIEIIEESNRSKNLGEFQPVASYSILGSVGEEVLEDSLQTVALSSSPIQIKEEQLDKKNLAQKYPWIFIIIGFLGSLVTIFRMVIDLRTWWIRRKRARQEIPEKEKQESSIGQNPVSDDRLTA